MSTDTLSKLSYNECSPFVPRIGLARCVRVYDGDTIHIGVVMPEPYGATRFCCRLLGVDTPELRTKNESEKQLARIARDLVRDKILNKIVHIRVFGMDKYGRVLVRVGTEGMQDVAAFLIDKGVAVAYDGGKKVSVDWQAMLAAYTQAVTPDIG